MERPELRIISHEFRLNMMFHILHDRLHPNINGTYVKHVDKIVLYPMTIGGPTKANPDRAGQRIDGTQPEMYDALHREGCFAALAVDKKIFFDRPKLWLFQSDGVPLQILSLWCELRLASPDFLYFVLEAADSYEYGVLINRNPALSIEKRMILRGRPFYDVLESVLPTDVEQTRRIEHVMDDVVFSRQLLQEIATRHPPPVAPTDVAALQTIRSINRDATLRLDEQRSDRVLEMVREEQQSVRHTWFQLRPLFSDNKTTYQRNISSTNRRVHELVFDR